MIENLLWPKKLTTPPQLVINPATMFGGYKSPDGDNTPIPLINIETDHSDTKSSIRFLEFTSCSFSIGCLMDARLNPTGGTYGSISLPFQEINFNISEYRCHGWYNQSSFYDGAEPDKTSSLPPTGALSSPNFLVGIRQSDSLAEGGGSSLFKMEGDDLENYGSGKQFSSNGTYIILSYTAYPDFFSLLPSVFGGMFRDFASTGTVLAIEPVIQIEPIASETSDGFKVGVKPF